MGDGVDASGQDASGPITDTGTDAATTDAARPPDCEAVAAARGWSLCGQEASRCSFVFEDAAGCAAVCAAAGLRCAQSYENVEGSCGADRLRPSLDCRETAHGSDYCVCDADAGGLDAGAPDAGDAATVEWGERKAFPSAFGAAAYVTGGRGGRVVHVTNLRNEGPGSLRAAFDAPSPKTIVFDVSGTIDLTTTLTIRGNDWTLAGQSAPEPGISLTGRPVHISGVRNAIVRYVRFRPDYDASGNVDAVNLSNVSELIIDHVSASWGGDECMSVVGESRDVTIQRTVFAESKTGCLLGDSNAPISDNLSLHTSLFYNISHRFPNVNAATRSDIINTVVHNWNTRLMVVSTAEPSVNEIGNYRQRGSRSVNVLTARVHEGNWLDVGSASNRPGIRVFTSGNVINDVLEATDDSWLQYRHRFDIASGAYAGIRQWDAANRDFQVDRPFPLLGAPIPIQTANDAFADVARDVGACRTLTGNGDVVVAWDGIDNGYLAHVRDNTFEAYSFPPVAIVSNPRYRAYQDAIRTTPIETRPDGYDSDRDGLPDAWEEAVGLDPSDAGDGALDRNGDGYTNLEDFLNQVDR